MMDEERGNIIHSITFLNTNEMNEREGRKRLILRIHKRNDCFGRGREIECVVWKRRMSLGVI